MTGCLVFRGLVDAGVFDEIEAARIWPHAKTDLVFGRSKVSGDQNFKLYLLERKMHKPPDKKRPKNSAWFTWAKTGHSVSWHKQSPPTQLTAT